ncbi:MAG TPA: hypothetical protein VN604_02150 [Nitrospirota bacterium]|nr:hypothetical protein [Nitrospirota bacterium]
MTTGMRAILFFLFFIAGSTFVLAIRVLNLVFDRLPGKAGKRGGGQRIYDGQLSFKNYELRRFKPLPRSLEQG